MARIEELPEDKSPLVGRVIARVAKRKLGRVSEMIGIMRHVPKVSAGWAAFELLFDRSRFVERKLRKLAATKAAMQLVCAP